MKFIIQKENIIIPEFKNSPTSQSKFDRLRSLMKATNRHFNAIIVKKNQQNKINSEFLSLLKKIAPKEYYKAYDIMVLKYPHIYLKNKKR